MQIRTGLIVLGASLLAAMPASADEFYLDGGFSVSAVNTDHALDPVIDPNFESLGTHFGFDLTKHISLEGEAIIGLESDLATGRLTFTPLPGDTEGHRVTDFYVDTKLNYIAGAYVRGTIPVTSKLNVFGRLGYSQVEFDQDITIRSFTDGSDEDPTEYSRSNISVERGTAFGAGATYDLTKKIYIRGDYTRYNLDTGELDNVMLGAGFRF